MHRLRGLLGSGTIVLPADFIVTIVIGFDAATRVEGGDVDRVLLK